MLTSPAPLVLMGALVVTGCARSSAQPPATAIVNITVVDAERGVARAGQTVILEGERIAWVGSAPEARVPVGARVIDGDGRWLVPGLIDAHVHLFQSGGPYTRPDVVDLREQFPYERELARTRSRIAVTLRRWLATGVTAVADLGGPTWTFEVRDASRAHAAPHVAVAGPLISTVARPELDVDGDPAIVQARSPQHAAALTRAQLARNSDFVKFWFIHRPGDDLRAQTELLRAVVEVAHAADTPVVVHATELRVAKAALRAGADILAHSIEDRLVDAELLRLARARDAIYVTTLFVGEGYGLALSGRLEPTELERALADPDVLAELCALEPRWEARPSAHIARENLRRVWEAGITVAVGSDAGNIGTLHGPGYHREIRQLEAAGLTPAQILRAATVNGARVMGLEDRVGRIAPGWLADLVLLDADPLEDASHLASVHRVIRGGEVYAPEQLVAGDPAECASRPE